MGCKASAPVKDVKQMTVSIKIRRARTGRLELVQGPWGNPPSSWGEHKALGFLTQRLHLSLTPTKQSVFTGPMVCDNKYLLFAHYRAGMVYSQGLCWSLARDRDNTQGITAQECHLRCRASGEHTGARPQSALERSGKASWKK